MLGCAPCDPEGVFTVYPGGKWPDPTKTFRATLWSPLCILGNVGMWGWGEIAGIDVIEAIKGVDFMFWVDPGFRDGTYLVLRLSPRS